MMKCIQSMFVFLLCCFFPFSYAENATAIAKQTSPVGYWQTIDDITGQPKAIVQLWLTPDQKLYGRIIKFYPSKGHDEHELCVECKGSRHNQPILGMVFLEDLEQNANNKKQWINGNILDPKNGKVYRSQLRLIDNGQKLDVKGYIGVPLFGRTQTWIRVNLRD